MEYASQDPRERINWLSSMPFFAFHALAVAALFVGVNGSLLILCGVLYFVRMFFITAGYHRYFSHRSFKTARTMQFLLALGGTTAVQKGPLWWAAHHRKHHLYADTDRDIHSPQRGFWWSHVGWFCATSTRESTTATSAIWPSILNFGLWIGTIGLGPRPFSLPVFWSVDTAAYLSASSYQQWYFGMQRSP